MNRESHYPFNDLEAPSSVPMAPGEIRKDDATRSVSNADYMDHIELDGQTKISALDDPTFISDSTPPSLAHGSTESKARVWNMMRRKVCLGLLFLVAAITGVVFLLQSFEPHAHTSSSNSNSNASDNSSNDSLSPMQTPQRPENVVDDTFFSGMGTANEEMEEPFRESENGFEIDASIPTASVQPEQEETATSRPYPFDVVSQAEEATNEPNNTTPPTDSNSNSANAISPSQGQGQGQVQQEQGQGGVQQGQQPSQGQGQGNNGQEGDGGGCRDREPNGSSQSMMLRGSGGGGGGGCRDGNRERCGCRGGSGGRNNGGGGNRGGGSNNGGNGGNRRSLFGYFLGQ